MYIFTTRAQWVPESICTNLVLPSRWGTGIKLYSLLFQYLMYMCPAELLKQAFCLNSRWIEIHNLNRSKTIPLSIVCTSTLLKEIPAGRVLTLLLQQQRSNPLFQVQWMRWAHLVFLTTHPWSGLILGSAQEGASVLANHRIWSPLDIW